MLPPFAEALADLINRYLDNHNNNDIYISRYNEIISVMEIQLMAMKKENRHG